MVFACWEFSMLIISLKYLGLFVAFSGGKRYKCDIK